MIKQVILIIFMILGSILRVSAQTNIADLEPEEYFDFWVGEWEVSWDEGSGKMGKGINVIEKP